MQFCYVQYDRLKNSLTNDFLLISCIFHRTTRRPYGGGRRRLFTREQELAIVNVVLANNTIRLHQLQEQITTDNATFHNITRVSVSTLCRILRKHAVTMKHLYRVPFERNSIRVKYIRYEYVQVSFTVLYCNKMYSCVFGGVFGSTNLACSL